MRTGEEVLIGPPTRIDTTGEGTVDTNSWRFFAVEAGITLLSVLAYVGLAFGFRAWFESLNWQNNFPGEILGLLVIWALLLVLRAVSLTASVATFNFLFKGTNFFLTYLPLFYVGNILILPNTPLPNWGWLILATFVGWALTFLLVLGFTYMLHQALEGDSYIAPTVRGPGGVPGVYTAGGGIVPAGVSDTTTTAMGGVPPPTKYDMETGNTSVTANMAGARARVTTRQVASSRDFSMPKMVGDSVLAGLGGLLVVLLIINLIVGRTAGLRSDTGRFFALFYLITSVLLTYFWGLRLPKQMTATILHPLITCTVLTWGLMFVLAIVMTGTPNDWYHMQELFMPNVDAAGKLDGNLGPGNWLMWFLSPAVISIGALMYMHSWLVADNLLTAVACTVFTILISLFGNALLARAFRLDALVRLSLVPRNLFAPLVVEVARLLSTSLNSSLALSFLTAFINGALGPPLMSAMGVLNPVVRGITLGCNGQILGPHSEADTLAFQAMSMTLVSVITTLFVAIPGVQGAIKATAGI